MTITSTESNVSLLKQEQMSGGNIGLEIFDSIKGLEQRWKSIQPKDDIYLEYDYLMALEEAPAEGMSFAYMLFTDQGKDIGLAAYQIRHFNLKQSLANRTEDTKERSGIDKIGKSLRDLFAQKISYTALVCGSALLTGEHGFHFVPDSLEYVQQVPLISKSINVLIKEFGKRGTKISLVLAKDFFEWNAEATGLFKNDNYIEFQVQPNMALDLKPEWKSFEDYLAEMTSKYRVKTKKGIKRGDRVERRVLDLDYIEHHKEEMYDYYLELIKDISFNMAVLNKDYFASCKRHLGDRFNVVGYFIDGEFIGFYSTMECGHKLLAHFIGYDDSLNREYGFYKNILLDLVKDGIKGGFTRLVYSRTAMEIKSSVGAKAYDMNCYLKHRSPLISKILKPIVTYYTPKVEWKERHPFKS
jgi:hypothetical protein